MVKELHNAFDSVESSDARCLILAHQGPAFSSGHDLREIHAMQAVNDRESVAKLFAQTASLVQRLPAMSIPVIAAINGVAAAAGCQLALSADIVVATESSSFSTPGARVGLFCTTPGVAVACSAPTKIAAEMLLCGHGIPAQRAAQVGMINFAVPDHPADTPKPGTGVPDGAESAALAHSLVLAATIALHDAEVIAGGKAAMRQVACTSGLDKKYAIASDLMASAVGTDACREGISAFLDKRKPVWPSV
jgi:enoyl-CoA hydratase/carnithine racemase